MQQTKKKKAPCKWKNNNLEEEEKNGAAAPRAWWMDCPFFSLCPPLRESSRITFLTWRPVTEIKTPAKFPKGEEGKNGRNVKISKELNTKRNDRHRPPANIFRPEQTKLLTEPNSRRAIWSFFVELLSECCIPNYGISFVHKFSLGNIFWDTFLFSISPPLKKKKGTWQRS